MLLLVTPENYDICITIVVVNGVDTGIRRSHKSALNVHRNDNEMKRTAEVGLFMKPST